MTNKKVSKNWANFHPVVTKKQLEIEREHNIIQLKEPDKAIIDHPF